LRPLKFCSHKNGETKTAQKGQIRGKLYAFKVIWKGCMYLRAIGESLYQGRKPSGKLVATIMRVQGYFFVTVKPVHNDTFE